MSVMTIRDEEQRVSVAESHIRLANSYKAFVDPAKLAGMLSCYCTKPWDKLSALINAQLSARQRRPSEDIKGQLRSIWKRRNQIGHEADINSALAGVSLWLIDKVDAEITIGFISLAGSYLPQVISEPLGEEEIESEEE